MESSAELIKWILENLNYWVVTLFMTIESSFIPFPSEVIVPPAAWKSNLYNQNYKRFAPQKVHQGYAERIYFFVFLVPMGVARNHALKTKKY